MLDKQKYFKNYEILVSESVGKGHPDKICDQISDRILDACLKVDPESRVACEVMAANTLIVVSGEITTKANINVENEVWKVIKPLGYDENAFTIICNINKQSKEIAAQVNLNDQHYAAGDQGITYGYATNETKQYLPLQLVLSHALLQKIEELRVSNKIPYLQADMKSQVELHKQDNQLSVNKVILALQHDKFPNLAIKEKWKQDIINAVLPIFTNYNLQVKKEQIFVNKNGDFIIGGPIGDSGLTGRKLQVDTYGTVARHGGGSFSGKDYTKVDRTGAYLARWIAKNVVYNNLADECEIGLAWQIGQETPDELIIECFNTNKCSYDEIRELIIKNFKLNEPHFLTNVINELKLKTPIYHLTSVYGHFGKDFEWEKTFKFTK